MKKLIIASTSTVHGDRYLGYLLSEIAELFAGAKEIIFVPFARPGGISHDEYTTIVRQAFFEIKINVRGIHEFEDPISAIEAADGIFTGGGNTFLLVSQLYKFGLMDAIANAVRNGTPYLGTSAGSNITGLTMQTTNDMPIVYPPSFRTLGLVPFNLNPHYLDPIPGGTHMGETRETRINEFHRFNTIPVVGLREGSWLAVNGESIELKGALSARIFTQGNEPYEAESGTSFSDLK